MPTKEQRVAKGVPGADSLGKGRGGAGQPRELGVGVGWGERVPHPHLLTHGLTPAPALSASVSPSALEYGRE